MLLLCLDISSFYSFSGLPVQRLRVLQLLEVSCGAGAQRLITVMLTFPLSQINVQILPLRHYLGRTNASLGAISISPTWNQYADLLVLIIFFWEGLVRRSIALDVSPLQCKNLLSSNSLSWLCPPDWWHIFTSVGLDHLLILYFCWGVEMGPEHPVFCRCPLPALNRGFPKQFSNSNEQGSRWDMPCILYMCVRVYTYTYTQKSRRRPCTYVYVWVYI